MRKSIVIFSSLIGIALVAFVAVYMQASGF